MRTSAHHALRTTLTTIISAGLLMMLPALTGTASAETVCPNAAMRTGASANLPDCRAYELVTPVHKNGAEATVEEISPTGESVSIFDRGVLLPNITGDIDGSYSFYTLTRTGEGWMPTSTAPPASEYEGPYPGLNLEAPHYLKGMSRDGRSTLWVTRRRSEPEPERRVGDLYLEKTPGGPLTEVGPVAPPSWPPPEFVLTSNGREGEELGTTEVADYSQDLSHVLLAPGESGEFRKTYGKYQWSSAETAEGDPTLYEYIGTGNTEPLPVGVNNDGKVISDCGTVLGARRPELEESDEVSDLDNYTNGDNSISADGSTVFFVARAYGSKQAASCSSGLVANELYARIDNGEPGAHTVSISEPSEAACRACDTEVGVREAAYFQGASEDGSKVFFTTEQPLLGDDTSNNLYEYNLDAKPGEETVVRVSGGDGTLSKEPGAAEVAGVSAISQDGSHVYFVAGGVLTLTQNGQGQEAIENADNLYVFDTETRATSFVADLCSGYPGEKEKSGYVTDPHCPAEIREPIFPGTEPIPGSDAAVWGNSPLGAGNVPERVDTTPDGRFLVFTSFADLTPGDTSTAAQVFEYDAQTGSLVRVSVGQDGFNDNGNSDNSRLNASIVYPRFGRVSDKQTPAQRLTVSADGSYVFFQSALGLTSQALDGVVVGQAITPINGGREFLPENVYAENVYEYHDGNVYLISDGKDVSGNQGDQAEDPVVNLLGTDPSGQDVFFTTADALVPQDTDGAPDVYDARIDGGFPVPEVRPQCVGDECQGPLSGAPVLLSPGSEFQAGGSNFKPVVSTPVKGKAKAKPKAKAKKKREQKSKKGKASAMRRDGSRTGKLAGHSERGGK